MNYLDYTTIAILFISMIAFIANAVATWRIAKSAGQLEISSIEALIKTRIAEYDREVNQSEDKKNV